MDDLGAVKLDQGINATVCRIESGLRRAVGMDAGQ